MHNIIIILTVNAKYIFPLSSRLRDAAINIRFCFKHY
jgi:hypothetical protein